MFLLLRYHSAIPFARDLDTGGHHPGRRGDGKAVREVAPTASLSHEEGRSQGRRARLHRPWLPGGIAIERYLLLTWQRQRLSLCLCACVYVSVCICGNVCFYGPVHRSVWHSLPLHQREFNPRLCDRYFPVLTSPAGSEARRLRVREPKDERVEGEGDQEGHRSELPALLSAAHRYATRCGEVLPKPEPGGYPNRMACLTVT